MSILPIQKPQQHEPADTKLKEQTLGTVQLRDNETNEIILVPTPSNDPKDPLNWSSTRKYYIFSLTCFGIFFAHAVIVGPAVALELITIEFFGPGPDSVRNNIAKASYLQTGCSLMIGVGNLIWVPLAIKYGRRPVYIVSYLLLTASCIWTGVAASFGSALVGRLFLGFACAAAEIVAPLTITDLFFLHQRGRAMVSVHPPLATPSAPLNWRMIFWIFSAFVGTCTVLVLFTFPETHYRRRSTMELEVVSTRHEAAKPSSQCLQDPPSSSHASSPSKWTTYLAAMRVFSGTYTSEPLLALMLRPLAAIALPAVFWATLINAITTGMIVVISANFSNAFSTVYDFQTWQSGLTYLSTILGSFLAIFCGGHFTDWVADKLTIRSGGTRIPEMRLLSMVISLITGPLSCVLYGLGFGKKLYWICATIGIGLVNFTTVQSNNVALVYILDSYRPIAGEVIVTQSFFKGETCP
ncbi:hypothetical protein CSAL01_07989 [Colletotrichum salicis]|uniref:Major facilitator superfamily (MFS) profile domain-containing protein n=1 Tax=Colletotrichum salicis TaxID=1209931 RepID=A0A135TR20_9PEZI|nr:hypothetical protein CSAL01_07989 [Colletotrichum salicis]